MIRLKTILVPTDFSNCAKQALCVAQSLAREHGATLVVVNAPPTPPPDIHNYLARSTLTLVREEAENQLQADTEPLKDVPVQVRVSIGDPGPTIVSIASDCGADLIVMGTHGFSGVSRLLLGSVAEYVMRHAPCPVMTIKQGTAKRLEQGTGLDANQLEQHLQPQV